MTFLQSTEAHIGKTIARFEDKRGVVLSDLVMLDNIVIVFTDGTKITLEVDQLFDTPCISQTAPWPK